MIWAAPLLIIIALGALTWIGTHLLDPYRPLDRIDAQRPVPRDAEAAGRRRWWRSTGSGCSSIPSRASPSVNELAVPVDRPIRFQITSSSVMNSFYVPALAGMIYAMPGMETKLHAVINQAGDYEGFSANYSGAGFSDMRFKFHGLDDAGFDALGRSKAARQRRARSRDATWSCASPSEQRAGAPLRRVARRSVRRHPQPLRRAGHDVHASA